MPIYEFSCDDCNVEHEQLVRSHDTSNLSCPSCGSSKLSKKLSVFAAASSDQASIPDCSGNPSSCGRCQFDN
ncbi:MAG: FmdB family zinc ribbon protein [Limisphaerales bacterium]|nr:zinc ribbon domain-containing protein [Verrucomicrobiota bacterium]